MNRTASVSLSLLALTCLALAPAAHAQFLALDFTGGSVFNNTQFPRANGTIGWTFAVTSPVTVVSLGVWDEGANGLNASKQIGLWNNSDPNTLIAQTTVTSASTPVASTSTAGQWLFQSITPLALATGNYTIGELLLAGDTDNYHFGTSTPTMASGLTYGIGRYPTNGDVSTSLKYPNGNGAIGYFGPNFQIASASPVPEPGSVALFVGLGVAGAGFVRKRRK